MTTDLVPVRRALLSVSDKTGLVDLAHALAARGIALVSTGGTARALREAGLAVEDVTEVTGFPEMLGGRVKTLHPMIHGGLLFRRDDPEQAKQAAAHGIAPVDLLVVNLYPFEAALASGAGFDECIEQIDIGGPAMLRAAAKNHAHVAVVTDVADYAVLLAELAANDGATSDGLRRRLALAAFERTAAYDAAIAGWLAGNAEEAAPQRRVFVAEGAEPLRYGENPHQRAALYRMGTARPGVVTAERVQGKTLSYNNIADADAAFELAAEFPGEEAPVCVIVKHGVPCGVAKGATLAEAYRAALACDRVSAFGGIVAVNRALDAGVAAEIAKIFTEVVIAPAVTDEAARILGDKPNLRLLAAGSLPDPVGPGLMLKQVAGGLLVQDRDAGAVTSADLKVVTRRAPSAGERRDLLFAWTIAKHVRSNAIVYAKGEATVGIGAGQTSRVDSTRIAARKAEDMARDLSLAEPPTRGSVVASDAFFPFADGLEAAAAAGATAVIQPGGSMRDDEVIRAADRLGIAMVFTGMRHFRH